MAKIQIEVDVNDTQAVAALKRLQSEIAGVRPIPREVAHSVSSFKEHILGVTGAAQKLARALVSVQTIAVYATTYLGAKKIIEAADAWTQLSSRLLLVEGSSQAVGVAQAKLFRLAQELRIPLQDVTQLYSRLALNTQQLGLSQEQTLTITRATAQAFQISGSTAGEAAAGVIQFTQALASNNLQGDELRTLLESQPRLLRAIAQGLEEISPEFAKLTASGMAATGAIRALAKAGKLDAGLILQALQTQFGALDREFLTLTRTIGQAWTQLINQIFVGMKSVDTSALLKSLDKVRSWAASPATLQAFSSFATSVLNALGTIAETVPAMFEVVTGHVRSLTAVLQTTEPLFRPIFSTLIAVKDSYLSLPAEVQAVGLIPAALFGVKGLAIFLGGSLLFDRLSKSWQAFKQGMSLGDLATSGPADVEKFLKDQEEALVKFRDKLGLGQLPTPSQKDISAYLALSDAAKKALDPIKSIGAAGAEKEAVFRKQAERLRELMEASIKEAKLAEMRGDISIASQYEKEREAVERYITGIAKLLPQIKGSSELHAELSRRLLDSKIRLEELRIESLKLGDVFAPSQKALERVKESLTTWDKWSKTPGATPAVVRQFEGVSLELQKVSVSVEGMSEHLNETESDFMKASRSVGTYGIALNAVRSPLIALDETLLSLEKSLTEAHDPHNFTQALENMKRETQAAIERADIMEQYNSDWLGAGKLRIEAYQKELKFLEDWKVRLLALGATKSEITGVTDAILETKDAIRQAERESLTLGNALERAFGGVVDILSIFGIKLGKIFILLQNLPKVASGLREVFAGVGGLMTLLGAPSTGQAFQEIGNPKGPYGGLGGFFQGITNLLGAGGSSSTSTGGGGLSSIAGLFGGMNDAMLTKVFDLFTGGGQSFLGFGGSGAAGAFGNMLPMLSTAAAFVPGVMDLFKGNVGGGLFSLGGAGIGAMIGGPIGAGIGAALGSMIGKLFGFGKPPMSKVKGHITMGQTTAEDVLAAQRISQDEIDIRGKKAFAVSGPFDFYLKKRHMKGFGKRDATEAIAEVVLTVVQEAVRGLRDLSKKLPTTALSDELSLRLDAALEEGFDIAFKFQKRGKPKKVAKKFNKWLAETLPGELLEELTDTIFPTIDLKNLGGGDLVKGFDGLMQSMGLFSEVVKRTDQEIRYAEISLDAFAEQSIAFVERFQKAGESFQDVMKRIAEGLGTIFTILDAIPMELAAASGASGPAITYLVDAFQDASRKLTETSDALTVAVESGAPPDEVAAAAQAVRDALTTSGQVLSTIQERLAALNATIVSGIDLYGELSTVIRDLTGEAGSIGEFIDEIFALGDAAQTIGARISIFGSALAATSSDLTAFAEAAPQLSAVFDDILASIQNTANNAEAIGQLQALAQAVTNGTQALYQSITDAANIAREAAQSASDARIQALEDERQAIQDITQEQEEANKSQLDALRQWKSIAESAKAQLVDLFNLLAPTHPEAAFGEVLAQFRSAVSGFGPQSTPEAAIQIQELARQVLQLAQGVPGMDLPSLAFQSLAAEVKAALEAVKSVAEGQPTEEELLASLVDNGSDQSARLAEIDAAIRAEQASLQQTLEIIASQEQQQREAVNAQQVIELTAIREHLAERLIALQAEQEAARQILEQITGELTWEQFIASKQAESVDMLAQIRDLLSTYLSSLIDGAAAEVGGGSLAASSDTVSQILKEAGYSKKQRERMSLIDAQAVLGFDSSMWTELLFPLGFAMETTLKDFFKQTFNTRQFDFTLAQIEARLREMLDSVPAMALGGYIPARPGGTLIRVGEGGEGEYVTPASRMNVTRSDQVTIQFSPTIYADSKTDGRRVAKEFIGEFSEWARTPSGRRVIQSAVK